jgi:hypothetical protein
MKLWKILIITLLIALAYGCSSNEVDGTNDLQESFTKIIPASDINNSIVVF